MLTFESTHEYYMGNDPSIFYCAEHGSLVITEDHSDRLLITGIDKDTMLKFAAKFYKESLKNELSKDKEAEDKDALLQHVSDNLDIKA